MAEMSLESLAVDLAKHDAAMREKVDDHERRITGIEKRQDNLEDLTASVKVLVTRQDVADGDIKEIKADVKELKDKPAKRWDAIVAAAISSIVCGVLGFVLAQLLH